MKKMITVFMIVLGMALASVYAETLGSFHLIRSIQLPNVESHFDHFGVDASGGRLFATLQSENVVHIFQLKTGKEIQKITGIGKPHAVLFRPDLNRIYITDGNHDHGRLHIVDGRSYSVLKNIDLAPGAEQFSYDPVKKYMYVANGGHDANLPYALISVIDTTSGEKLSDIRIETPNLEGLALETSGTRLFVNDRLNSKVVVVDRMTQNIVASWPIATGKLNVAMALDEAHHRLFVGCRSGHLIVFDTETGNQVATLPINEGVDDLTFDAASKRIFAACGGGNGSVEAYAERDPDHYELVAKVVSGPGGKNGIYVPSLHRYFVGVPRHETSETEVLVYDIR